MYLCMLNAYGYSLMYVLVFNLETEGLVIGKVISMHLYSSIIAEYHGQMAGLLGCGFVLLCPSRLMPYLIICFSVSGWPCSVFEYKYFISGIINKMFQLLESGVLPENRTIVAGFLGHYNFVQLELMLRSVSPYYYNLDAYDLDDKLRSYTKEEEARMEKNLKGVAYEIDDMNTLSLITGEQFEPLSSFSWPHHTANRARENRTCKPII
jgi:hypothetical protein